MPSVIPPITAIVLAAGKGHRFGGDKMLQPIPVINSNNPEHTLPMGLRSALNVRPHVDQVICVVRPDDKALIQVLHEHAFKTVINHEFELGLSSSIKAGVRSAHSDHHIMICLGDMPFITEASYESIIQAFYSQPSSICRGCFVSGSDTPLMGHPVIFPHVFRPQLLALQGDKGAQSIMQSLPINTIKIEDKGIIKDIDHKSDL